MRYGDNKKRNECKTKKERKKPNRIKWHCFYCSCYISDPLITVILMIFTISQQQLHLSRELKLEQQQSHDNNKEQEGACQNVSVIREKDTEGECTKWDYHQIKYHSVLARNAVKCKRLAVLWWTSWSWKCHGFCKSHPGIHAGGHRHLKISRILKQ